VQLAFGNQDVCVCGSRDPMSWHDSILNQLITLIPEVENFVFVC